MNIVRHDITLEGETHPKIIFLRATPENLESAIRQTLEGLSDLSWLNTLDDEALKKAFTDTATPTINELKEKVDNLTEDSESDIGEYLVSFLGKLAVVTSLTHKDIPLRELLSERKSGAEGFDFYTVENSDKLVVCGEAKYVKGKNPYSNSLSQIKRFIDLKKHSMSYTVITHFLKTDDEKASGLKLTQGKHGVTAAFSCTNIDTTQLINNIKRSAELKPLFDRELIILVAVEVA